MYTTDAQSIARSGSTMPFQPVTTKHIAPMTAICTTARPYASRAVDQALSSTMCVAYRIAEPKVIASPKPTERPRNDRKASPVVASATAPQDRRSEERRVGKEGRDRGGREG